MVALARAAGRGLHVGEIGGCRLIARHELVDLGAAQPAGTAQLVEASPFAASGVGERVEVHLLFTVPMASDSAPAPRIAAIHQDEVLTGEAVALDVQPLGFFLRALGTVDRHARGDRTARALLASSRPTCSA